MREYSIRISPSSAGSGSSGSLYMFSGVFIAEKVDAVGNKVCGDTDIFGGLF
jgi:hypothetical protein